MKKRHSILGNLSTSISCSSVCKIIDIETASSVCHQPGAISAQIFSLSFLFGGFVKKKNSRPSGINVIKLFEQ